MKNNFAIIFILSLTIPVIPETQQDVGDASLEALHQAIVELVVQHYPDATSHVFDQEIGFEESTRIYVAQSLSKFPQGMEVPRETVRGPMKNGVWCRIWCRDGALNDHPAYQRAQGEIQREYFREHVYYPSNREKNCHLLVTLRLPLEKTKQQVKFTNELSELLNHFGDYLPAKR